MKTANLKTLVFSTLLSVANISMSRAQTNPIDNILRSTKSGIFDNFTRIQDPALQGFVTRVQEYKTAEIELLFTKDSMEVEEGIEAIISLYDRFEGLENEATFLAEKKFLSVVGHIQTLTGIKKIIQDACKKKKFRKIFEFYDTTGQRNAVVASPHIVGYRYEPVIWIYDTSNGNYYNLESLQFGNTLTISYRTTTDPSNSSMTSEPMLIHCTRQGSIGGGVDIVRYPAVSLYEFMSILDTILAYNTLQQNALIRSLQAISK